MFILYTFYFSAKIINLLFIFLNIINNLRTTISVVLLGSFQLSFVAAVFVYVILSTTCDYFCLWTEYCICIIVHRNNLRPRMMMTSLIREDSLCFSGRYLEAMALWGHLNTISGFEMV